MGLDRSALGSFTLSRIHGSAAYGAGFSGVIAWCIGSCQFPFLPAEVNGLCAMVGVDDSRETICRVAGYSAFAPSYRFWCSSISHS